MKKITKIAAMYREYGENEGAVCRDCCNYGMYNCGNHRVSKCSAYGLTHSTASDWNGGYTACGLYNMPFDETKHRPLISTLSHQIIVDIQCDGQMSFE